MARYKLIGNELVDITNKNKTNSTPTPYKIAQNKDKMLTQINHRKTNDSTTMYKIENEFKLRNEVNKNRRKYIDSKNILADTLNNQGLNVNRNNPFQANINSNNLINNSRTNLNGIVTLNDVVNNQKKVLENNKELVNNVNNSMSDYAKSNYLYNKQKVDNDNVSLYDKTLGTAVRGVSDLFSNIITPTSYIIDDNGRKVKAPTYNELKQSKVSENYNTGVGKFLGDATYNMSKILGSQAINAVTGGVGGTALYWSDMFFDNYHSRVRDGHDNNNAMAYALASTAAEYLTGKFLGSATKQLTGGKTNDYEQLLDKVFTKFISNKNVTTFLSNAGSEATEEFIQEYLDNINKNLILGENNKVFSLDTLADAVYSAGLGAISGGTIGLLNSKIYGETPDTNVIPDDITENIEEKKSNIDVSSDIYENEKTVNENNIKSNIDNKITSNTEIENIVNEINEYQQLKDENKLTSKQEQYLNQLKQKLNELQNTNTYTESSSQTRQILPTVQDIVNQEQATKNTSINLPVDNHQSIISNMNNANSEVLSSSKKILPTINDFNGSNINIPTNNIKVDTTKIKPEILEDIKNFKLGDPSIESYKGSYIKTMLNEFGIKVPNAMNYVSEVRPDMSFTTTKDLTRQQYASVSNALQKLRSVDVTGINNINDVAVSNNILPIDVSQINQTKGNIPINQELLNKYKSTNEMFRDSINNYNGEVNVKDNLFELQNVSVENMKIGEVKKLAKEIFQKYNKSNTFYNSNNKILVNKTGIDESITKIFESRQQRELLKEHLLVFSDLGDIIEHSKLVNQVPETKGREKYNSWNYYYDGLKIGNNSYNFEFEVVSMSNGENHYRVQKLEKINNKKAEVSTGSTNVGTLPVTETSAFSANNISQSNNNVNSDILPTINNMQNSEENANKILNPNEISKLTKEDANTTPILPVRGTINKVNDGDSHFANNIREKVNMLNADEKTKILSSDDVRYYDKVTNKESLEKAFKKINDGGSSETLRWVKQDSKNANATDVAEGWILLKQYADNGDYNSMVEVAKKLREIGTTAGQTVQAFNIMERMTPEGMVKYAQSELSEAYDKMVKNKSKEWIDKHREDFDLKPNEVKFIMDNMQEVQNMEDGYDKRVKLAEIQKLMTDKLPPKKGAKIKSWMRISMLFNPKTQVRNVAGNALIMPINSFGDLFSSYADKLIAKKTGVRTTGNTNIKAMLKGIKKGAYEATNDYKKGINTKDMEGNRFEISDGKSFSEKNLMGRTLNRTESLLNYVMDVGDRVFSEAAFENSLQNQLVLNNTTEITQEMIDIAHQEALSRTWNDNNNYTRFVLNARAGLNQFANIRGYGLGDVLIPFAKTPANLTKAIVDYSPAGLVSTINKGINLKKSLTNGQYTATMQHEFVQSLGKATAGTVLYILGIALAKAGITSGKSDDDKDTANFLKNTLGISSYSIKIGNKSFTYDWAQPLAAPLSITANVVNSKSSDTKALLEGIVGSLDTAGSILLEQSFLQSINDVLSDNDGVVSGIINEVLQLPARAVPTFSKQIADLVDGTQRTSFEYGKPVQSAINSIKAKIPFVSKTLNPTIDTMGREIQKYGGKNNIFNIFLNPANVNTENISKSAEEIYRLYKETGETDVMPRVAPYYINQKGEKVMMSGKDRVEYQKVSGKIIEDNIKKLINSTSYSNMSDSDKANVVKDIVDYSYNIAKKDVLGLELSNTYQKAYEYSKIGDIRDYYTFKESIDNTDKDTKRASVTKFLINSDLNNEQLAYLYGNYYSSDKVLNTLVQSNIPIKEYIKFNSETFDSDYYTNGKTVPNSRKNKVIKYINSLNLSIPQKAMLIKMEYSSFKQYDNQIVKYVNSINCSSYDKKIILKTIGFTSYDKDIINTINSKNISIEEKTKELEQLGFKVRNGKVYTK